MKKVLVIALIATMALTIGACGDDDDASDDPSNNEANGESNEVIDSYFSVYADQMALLTQFNCQCDWEDGDYSSAEECQEAFGVTEESKTAFVQCMQGEFQASAPEELVPALDCHTEYVEQSNQCLEDLGDDPTCSEWDMSDTCSASGIGDGESCDEFFTEEVEAWDQPALTNCIAELYEGVEE